MAGSKLSIIRSLKAKIEDLTGAAAGKAPAKKAAVVVMCSILFIFLIISMLSSYAGSRLNVIIKSELEKTLPEFERKWGMLVTVGGIDNGLITGSEIRDVRIGFAGGGQAKPFMVIPRLSVDYSLRFTPPFQVNVTGVTLKDPALTVTEETLDSLARLRRQLADNAGKRGSGMLTGRAGRFVSFDRDMHIDWKGAKISVANELIGAGKSPLIISGCRGTSKYDMEKRTGSLDVQGSIGEKSGEVRLHAEGREGEIDAKIQGRNLKLIELAPYLPRWVVLTEDTALNGHLQVGFRPGETTRKVKFEADLNKLGFDHWRIADRPLKNISLHAAGVLGWDDSARLINIESSQVGTGKVAVNLRGRIDYRGKPVIDANLNGDRLSIRDILAALPQEFIPTIYDADVSGHINLKLKLFLDLEGRRHVELDPDVEIVDFRIIKPPRAADITKLKKPFFHRAKKRGRVVKEFWVGPVNPDFVPYDRIGRNAIRAALTCEDGRFFHHDGFQIKHIKDSMRQNLREKRFARGASTISMQTAKNLFLSGNKTISRKFEEMLLTYAMEQELSKERILEIYMNIIEWGPDIYGIGRASRYYFDRKPKDLTLQEAAFLGSIIANPVRYHYMYRNGEVSDHWSDYIALIISKMHADRSEVEAIQSYKPEFGWVRKKRLQNEKRMEEAASENGKGTAIKKESSI